MRKYFYGITLIKSTQADREKNVDEFINDKIDFNTTHIIKSNIQPVTNVPEETRFISSMTLTGFKNDQDESRCYVNSKFQVLFFNIFFRTLIINIDCDRMLTNLDNSIYYYNGHIQKIMVLQVIQQIFCEMLIGGRKIVNSANFFLITNIRTNVQEDSSEFEALIQEMISFELFRNQEICHIDLNGEKRICTVSTYIKEYLSIVEIENKKYQT